MNYNLFKLSRRYASALQKYLKQGAKANLQSARGLGRHAVSLGLETRDMAKIHKEAMATLEASGSRDGIIKRAEIFFAEAVTPIEKTKTHSATLKASAQLHQANQTLSRRTAQVAASNQSLEQSIVRRQTVEKALNKSEGHSQKLLEESRRLQKHLQDLTRQILTEQEDKRKKLSRDLQDEIAQTLLGINIRLVKLKREAATTARDFKKDIANTQQLVEESAKSVNRFARELDVHRKRQETHGNSSSGRPAIRMKTKSNKGKVSRRSVLRERVSQ